ncbi:serine/threonine-protein kinase UCNL [Euphorbia lathyris]|uniref:serine/threonine-protein kinase UCNL n=1 Tax=Euphorbia lathyris TaxID=212925 RepID=UPI003313DD1A
MEPPPPQNKTSSSQPSPSSNFENIRAIKVLGKGAMGTVFLVHNTITDPSATNPYALKVVEKSSLHTKFDADRRARWEIEVLRQFSGRNSHPFLPHLISSFETPEFLAWAVPFCSGGDLNVLRYRQNDRVFSPAVVRFYLAEIVCAIEHLHEMGIVYRDLKPENILVQQSGHVTLTDFDLSRTLTKRTVKTILSSSSTDHHFDQSTKFPSELQKTHHRHRRKLTRWLTIIPSSNEKSGLKKTKSARVSPVSRRKLSFSSGERSNSFVGTEEYVSPEVVRGDGHEFAVDWWALGILTYEMLYGTTPFKGKNRKETFRNILMKKPEFIGQRNELTDLIERLLEKDPTKRLGYQRGACEIKEHVFFKRLRWDLLTEVLRPPFIPNKDDVNPPVTVTSGGLDIREYYNNLRAPPHSLPPSPLRSPSSYCHRNLSLTEF